MSTANKEAFFGLKPEVRDVPLPELGEGQFIRVRGLSGQERDRYEASLYVERKNKQKLNLENATARLIVLTCINEDGTPYFGDDEVDKLSSKVSAKILKRLAEAARELSGLTEEEQQELVGN